MANIRIASWNVNSIRARFDVLSKWLKKKQYEIIFVQETKVQDHEFPIDDIKSIGYEAIFLGQKSYNGVAILSKDRIGILNKGKLVALDSTQNLLNKINIKKVRFKLSNNNSFDRITLKSLSILKSESNELVVSYDKNKLTMNEIIEFLTSKSINILDISTDDGDLEDVFISLTNN